MPKLLVFVLFSLSKVERKEQTLYLKHVIILYQKEKRKKKFKFKAKSKEPYIRYVGGGPEGFTNFSKKFSYPRRS